MVPDITIEPLPAFVRLKPEDWKVPGAKIPVTLSGSVVGFLIVKLVAALGYFKSSEAFTVRAGATLRVASRRVRWASRDWSRAVRAATSWARAGFPVRKRVRSARRWVLSARVASSWRASSWVARHSAWRWPRHRPAEVFHFAAMDEDGVRGGLAGGAEGTVPHFEHGVDGFLLLADQAHAIPPALRP